MISNPASRRNRREGLAATLPLRRRPAIPHAVLEGIGQVDRVVAEFARMGVDLIVIDGGDGTVQRVVTAAATERGFATVPRFAILPSGTTNMTARDVGLAGARAAALEALLAGIESGRAPRTLTRATIALSAGGGPDILGFFLGAGAIAWATGATRDRIESRGLAGDASVVLGIGATIWRCLAGRPSEPPLAGVPMRLDLPGRTAVTGPRFLLLATTLHRLVLGLDPFWGEGAGPIKVLDIAAPPRRLLAALPALVRGRPAAWMADAGYRSLRTSAFSLAVDGPVLFDGEAVPVAPGASLNVRAGPDIAFVRPR